MDIPMHMRNVLKRSEAIVGLVRDSRKILRMLAPQNRSAKIYLASDQVKKLQLGAGVTLLEGWLSTDINPRSDRSMYLDATKRFPFDSNTFDYIYSEHMIEHLSWHQGLHMLRECRRVLRCQHRSRPLWCATRRLSPALRHSPRRLLSLLQGPGGAEHHH